MKAALVRRHKREELYGARFDDVARRCVGSKPGCRLGRISKGCRSAKPKPRTDVPKPSADPATATCSTDDAVPWSGSDTASPAVTTAESPALSKGGTITTKN